MGLVQPHGWHKACLSLSIITHVLTLNKNGEVLQKHKFDRNVFFECGGICSSNPGEDFWFVSNKKIGFRMYNHETDTFSTEEIEIE